MFTKVEEAYAVIVSKGVYRQCDVYERKSRLFVKYGSGFIYLGQRNSTSVTNVRLEEIVLPFEHKMTETGFRVNPKTYQGKMKDAS